MSRAYLDSPFSFPSLAECAVCGASGPVVRRWEATEREGEELWRLYECVSCGAVLTIGDRYALGACAGE